MWSDKQSQLVMTGDLCFTWLLLFYEDPQSFDPSNCSDVVWNIMTIKQTLAKMKSVTRAPVGPNNNKDSIASRTLLMWESVWKIMNCDSEPHKSVYIQSTNARADFHIPHSPLVISEHFRRFFQENALKTSEQTSVFHQVLLTWAFHWLQFTFSLTINRSYQWIVRQRLLRLNVKYSYR